VYSVERDSPALRCEQRFVRRLNLSDLLDHDLVVLESNTAMLQLLQSAADAEPARSGDEFRGHLQND